MGWGNGTEIFDQVAGDLMDVSYSLTRNDCDISIVVIPLKNLYKVLCDKDWDTECESEYWEHPVIGIILGNDELHDNWN